MDRWIRLGFGSAILVFGLVWGAPGLAIEMDELMEDVLDGVRQETRQSIQQQTKQETREVLTEEQVIPSSSLSGTYFGTVVFGPGDSNTFTCSFSSTGSRTSGSFTASCTSTDTEAINHSFSMSGTFSNSTFSFSITETTPTCPGTRTASGSGTISGEGAPGTTFTGSYGGTCGDSTGSFSMVKT